MGFLNSIQSFFNNYITLTNIERALEGYRGFGPLFGILLPMIEAILPIIPLVAIVIANAAAYGFFFGFLLSWLGSSLGSILVFLFFRKLARNSMKNWFYKRPKFTALFSWIEKKGFGPLFLIFCFPFTPSALVNVVAGVANVGKTQFIMAVLLGKALLIGIITYLGNDWESIILHPSMLAPILMIVVVLWFVGRTIEKKMTNLRDTELEVNERKRQQ